MIVRQFISWIRTAPAGERAEATRALARAWLISDLTEDDRIVAEGALLMLLDDPSPLVRQAMAEASAARFAQAFAPRRVFERAGVPQMLRETARASRNHSSTHSENGRECRRQSTKPKSLPL